jgi:hypothetical protein
MVHTLLKAFILCGVSVINLNDFIYTFMVW